MIWDGEEEAEVWDGEEEAEAGQGLGPEEDHLAICRLGRGQAGCSGEASAEALASDGGDTHIIQGPVGVSRGSRGGGGPNQDMDMDYPTRPKAQATAQDTDSYIQHTGQGMDIHTARRDMGSPMEDTGLGMDTPTRHIQGTEREVVLIKDR